jgi:hypothetical protein
MTPGTSVGMISRRAILQLIAAAGPALVSLGSAASARAQAPARLAAQQGFIGPASNLEEATIADLQAQMEAGRLTARRLLEDYLARIEAIDSRGPALNSIIEINPDARQIADALDTERARSGPRGPLHGIPILLKDNVDTADRTRTAAGSLALVDSQVQQDATVASRLRDAGAVLLGKAGLSEWAITAPRARRAAGADAAGRSGIHTCWTTIPAAPAPDRPRRSRPTSLRPPSERRPTARSCVLARFAVLSASNRRSGSPAEQA